jgi:hypothetical protein
MSRIQTHYRAALPAQPTGIGFVKRVCAVSLAVAGLTVGMMAPASAETTITRDSFVSSFTDQGLTDDCRPGITGTIVGTDTFKLQELLTSQGRHFIGTDTADVAITWSDGSYSMGGSVDHVSFTTGAGATEFTGAHEDSLDTYSADGMFLFRGTFHLVERFTFADGEVKVQIDSGHFHFFGGPCA